MKLRRFGSWLHLLTAGVLMLAVWLLLIWVGSRPALKTLIDLSPGRRATVDPVTIELLRELRQQEVQVEFHTFFLPSGQQPQDEVQLQMQRILGRLRELTTVLLRQYQFHGGDFVRLHEHDQFTDIAGTRAAAQRFGVSETDVVVVAVQQPGRESRHRKLSLEGDLAVIDLPGLQPNLPSLPRPGVPILKDYKGEEALSSALKGLLVQGTPTVYFLGGNSYDLSWHEVVGAGYGLLQRALRGAGFEVRELDLGRGAVPKDASMVAVLEPRREFADTEVRALYDYLQRGGRLFLNYSFAAQPDWNPDGGELGRLLGFEIGAPPVFHLVPDFRGAGPGIAGLPGVEKLDLVLNPNHAITRRLALANQLLQLGAARPIVEREDAPKNVRREPLLRTGAYAWLARARGDGAPDYDAPRMASAFDSFTVGLIVDVDGAAGSDGKPATGTAVVVSGVFANNAGMQINAPLALNICNWLCERRVLLDIRGSSYVGSHLELSPQQLDRAWWLLVAGVPGALLLLGLLVFFRRRSA